MSSSSRILWALAFQACVSAPEQYQAGGDVRLADLSREQTATECDWIARQYGGYGARPCDGGGTRTYQTQEECLNTFTFTSTCAATVAELHACVTDLSRNPCAPAGPASCAPLEACGQ